MALVSELLKSLEIDEKSVKVAEPKSLVKQLFDSVNKDDVKLEKIKPVKQTTTTKRIDEIVNPHVPTPFKAYEPYNIKLKDIIKRYSAINIRIPLMAQKGDVVDLLMRKLRYSFRDAIIVDDAKKLHHRTPETISDVFRLYTNTLVIYKDVECYLQDTLNSNFVIVLTYGYENICNRIQKMKIFKLMTNNYKVNLNIFYKKIKERVNRKYDADFETSLHNNPDYRALAINAISNINNKLIIDYETNRPIFNKIFSKLYLSTDNTYIKFLETVDTPPSNLDEVHFMSHFKIKYIMSILRDTNYTKKYPRRLDVYIYEKKCHENEVMKFIRLLDTLKKLLEYETEFEIHLVNDQLII